MLVREGVIGVGDDESAAIQMVQSSHWTARTAKIIAACFLIAPILVMLVPWVQNLRGQGRVIAYAPLERQQQIEAAVSGRIVSWNVQEGSKVARGEVLLEIADVDPELVDRLERQRSALSAKLQAYGSKVQSYELQVANLETTRDLSISVATLRLETQRQKVRAEEESLAAKRASLSAARAQFDRKTNLLRDGIVSKRQFEVAERDLTLAETSVNAAVADLAGAKQDQAAMEADLDRLREDAEAKINSARASLNDAKGQAEDARASLAKIETDLSRQRSQVVTAPRDGTVFRLLANEGGEIVKAGDPLLVLVPNTQDRAVEMWMDGNDAPLISAGDDVRLQFEGWPAVQFSGWPSVAVGTFGGKVALIDSTDDGRGRFRIVVAPTGNEPWPDVRYLRQGVRAKGWVLLKQVPLGYELWRQLNGFPPVIADEEPKSSGSKTDLARKRVK